MRTIASLIKSAAGLWWEQEAGRLGAALAYYSLFSITPLLLIVLMIGGLFLGNEETRKGIVQEVAVDVGPDASKTVDELLNHAKVPGTGAILLSIIIALIGATGVFLQLQSALNYIWKVPPVAGSSFVILLANHLTSFLVMLGTGFLLIVSLCTSTVAAAMGRYMTSRDIPGTAVGLQLIELGISFVTISMLFALIFKLLPAARIRVVDALVGGVFTAVLFLTGRYVISLYLAYVSPESTFGAAGSIVGLLVWIYYSAQIFLFGAAFVWVYARPTKPQAPN